MRIFVGMDTEARHIAPEGASGMACAQPITRFLLDEFGGHPSLEQARFLCQLLFELERPESRVWVCRRTRMHADTYFEAAESTLDSAVPKDDEMEYDQDTLTALERLANGRSPGYVHRVTAAGRERFATLLHRFWECAAGRWLFLGEAAPIGTAMKCADAADSCSKIQNALRRGVFVARLTVTTYDDNIVEGLSVLDPAEVAAAAISVAAQLGLDLDT